MDAPSAQGIVALIPAAGIGRRVGGEQPKQYRTLADKPLLLHTLERVQSSAVVDRVVVALAPNDPHFAALGIDGIETVAGGRTRAESVLSMLDAQRDTPPDAWVLVHDAARPCVHPQDIEALVAAVTSSGLDGGLLATRVRDTVKRAHADGTVASTVPRDPLWLAATPQMFRLGGLRAALRRALAAGADVTDEASAMEWAGCTVMLVEGRDDNIKVTRPADLLLAASILEAQHRELGGNQT